MVMTSAITTPLPKSSLYTPTSSSSSSSRSNTISRTTWSCDLIVKHKKEPIFGVTMCIPQLGIASFSQWSGLKPFGVSITSISLRNRREKVKRSKGTVRASLFGVGAPEALVIGVVALLVFGPKGLAEVARNLGKSLRAFQPTIRELQEVSREFKSTLEREIGLDDDISSQPKSNTYNSTRTNSNVSPPSSTGSGDTSPTTTDTNGISSPSRAYTSEEYLKITEEQLIASKQQQQNQDSALVGDVAVTAPPPQKPENEA